MAGMLAMFSGSMASGLLGPLLAQIPDIPGAAIGNPYKGMTSTGGNSVGAPIFDMFGSFLGSSGGSGSSGYSPYTTPYTSGANSGYYISQAPATTTTTTSSIDPNIILLGGAAIIAIVLLK